MIIMLPLRLTIDIGAETTTIKSSLSSYIGAKITKRSQLVLQADGRTPLSITGETSLALSIIELCLSCHFVGLVFKDIDMRSKNSSNFTSVYSSQGISLSIHIFF